MGRLIGATLTVLVALPAGAQEPKRPKLEANVDTNDWEAYYDFGIRHLQRFPNRSYEALYWATRLAPWSADPLYAQWVAFHMRDIGRFQRYLDDDRKVLASPDVGRSDSLASLAFLRNPYVHRALEIALYDALPGRWGGDTHTRAWIAYANQKLPQATELFGRVITQDPEKRYRLRHVRAVLFVAARQYDSASAEMTALLEKARLLDEKELVRHYESKAFYEYAIGRLELARGNRAAARAAFERAITEDLTFGPAHVWLATLAEAAGDESGALASYAQAIELAPADAIYRYQYAVFLLKVNRAHEALDQIRHVIAREPFYADAYVFKGAAHEQLGHLDSARVTYREYLERATRNAQNRPLATKRLAALDAPPSP